MGTDDLVLSSRVEISLRTLPIELDESRSELRGIGSGRRGHDSSQEPVRLFGRLVAPVPDAYRSGPRGAGASIGASRARKHRSHPLDLGLRSKRDLPNVEGRLIESKSGDKRILGRDAYGVRKAFMLKRRIREFAI